MKKKYKFDILHFVGHFIHCNYYNTSACSQMHSVRTCLQNDNNLLSYKDKYYLKNK